VWLLDGSSIGWLDLLHLIHSHNSGLHAIQRYRWSTHFIVHRCTHTKVLSCTSPPVTAAHMKSSSHSLIPFLPFLLNHLRLPSQQTLLILSAAWDPHIASGRPPQKTPFSNSSSVLIEVCLPRRCIETVVLLFRACSFPRELLYRVVA
jgi:hypothetical protein